jgi:hypothetical protein
MNRRSLVASTFALGGDQNRNIQLALGNTKALENNANDDTEDDSGP